MTEIVRLAPHDPIPQGPGKHVIVLHRFDEDAPKRTVTTITLTGQPDETTRPVHPDGKHMNLDEAIAAAQRVAESEKLTRVLVVDRTAGKREQDILQHGGDHSVHMDDLVDFDLEDGEHGPDMRDLR
jgi:hypothetical protein